VEVEGQVQEIESYFTTDGFFIKDAAANTWVKLPTSMIDQALQQTVDQEALDPSGQLADLLDYADQFTVNEKDGIYTFALTAQGAAFSELIQQKIDEQQAAWAQPVDIDVHAIEYVVEVEKASNKLLTMDVIMDMSMGGTEAMPSMNIKSDIKTTYSNHNAIGDIVVPTEALDAEEINLPEIPQ
jgi:hypothetical protein